MTAHDISGRLLRSLSRVERLALQGEARATDHSTLLVSSDAEVQLVIVSGDHGQEERTL